MANVEQERSRALWMLEPAVEAPSLQTDATADALVIGAGIAGLVTAYELARAGRAVTVVDRGRLARGMTARTTAHLTFELDDFFAELEALRGRDVARRWYESQSAAVDRIEEIGRTESIACDFARIDGYLVPGRESDIDLLHDELEAARACGFADAAWVDAGQQPWLTTPAVCFPRQARFHPMKFLNGVIAVLGRLGVRLYANTPIVSIDEKGGGVIAKTAGGSVVGAKDVIVATNAPILGGAVHKNQTPYRTYVVTAPVAKGEVPDVLMWDTLDPYHYVRIQPGDREDVLIVGGEDHKSGEADDIGERLSRLEQWMRERYPAAGVVSDRWSGQVYEPVDFVGFIGRSPKHERVFLITGDGGQGLTNGVTGALVLRDLVAGRANPWADIYDPNRTIVRKAKEHDAADAKEWVPHFGGGEAASIEDVVPGSGALVKIDGKMNAVYRAANDPVTRRLAACTHAGCTVRWNGFEECWDCPCHGSQFAADGEPLQAPAVFALEKP